jgi:DNA-binding IclR family transcriptional regulator
LVVEEYGHGVYLVCEKGDKAVNLDIYPGVRRSLHLTASGKAILANLPTDRLDEIIEQHGLPAKTAQSITNRKELVEQLEEVRERGFAVDDQEHINGLRCIGAPIQSKSQTVLGAVSISVPVTRMDDEQFYNDIPDMVRSATNVIELHVQNS